MNELRSSDQSEFTFVKLKLARVPACSPLPVTALPSMSLIPSAPLKLVSYPRFDSCAPAHLKLAPFPTRSLLPSQFYLLCRFSQSSIRPLGLPIYVARVPAAPFSLLPSSLYLLCRASRALHSIFILVLFTFVYAAAVTHVLFTAGTSPPPKPAGAW